MTETTEAYNVPRGAAYFTSQQVKSYIAYFLFSIILASLVKRHEIGRILLLTAYPGSLQHTHTNSPSCNTTRYVSSSLGKGQVDAAGPAG